MKLRDRANPRYSPRYDDRISKPRTRPDTTSYLFGISLAGFYSFSHDITLNHVLRSYPPTRANHESALMPQGKGRGWHRGRTNQKEPVGGSIPVEDGKEDGGGGLDLVRCCLFILVKSRNEEERRKNTPDEEGRLRQETREMMPPSATTPSAAIRTKRIARSPPLLVHDDDRKDDFVAKMYFTDDIDGGIELDWCFRGGRGRYQDGTMKWLGWPVYGGGKRSHLLHFGAESGSSSRVFVYFCLRAFHRPWSSYLVSRSPFLLSFRL